MHHAKKGNRPADVRIAPATVRVLRSDEDLSRARLRAERSEQRLHAYLRARAEREARLQMTEHRVVRWPEARGQSGLVRSLPSTG